MGRHGDLLGVDEHRRDRGRVRLEERLLAHPHVGYAVGEGGGYSRPMRLGAGIPGATFPVVAVLVLCGCSSRSTTSAVSPSFDAGRMDVHPSSRHQPSAEDGSSGEEPAEEGPDPGETFASPPAESIPPGARVPRIRGMDYEDAVMALRVLGMDYGFVVARTSPEDPWTVLEQAPGAGDRPASDGRVSMVVSMGPSAEGVAGAGEVACKPEEDDIDEPYCQGKILRY
jgi:hypothetical protein